MNNFDAFKTHPVKKIDGFRGNRVNYHVSQEGGKRLIALPEERQHRGLCAMQSD